MLDHQKDDDDNEVCAPMAKPPDADALNETAVGLFLDALNGTKPRGNVLYSPLGVASALAAASRGRAMPGFAPANDHVVATLRELLPCDQLKLGNLLHLDPRTSLSKEYQTFFEEGLAGKIIRTPKDSKVAEDVPASTNRWATQLTDGAVTHVIDVIDVLEEPDLPTASSPPPSADEETSIKSATHDDLCKRVGCPAYLVNLVHICSHWEEGFGRVMPHPFYEHPQKASIVAMMTRRSEFPYLRQDGYSCLRVPMACKANMSLFLPTLRSGLDDVLPVFSSWKQLKCVLDRAVWTTDVTLTLPKVELESHTLDLKRAIKDHNFRMALSAAELTDDSVRLRGIYHKATMDLVEDGGQAPLGFSTLLSLSSAIPPNKPVNFLVDRPFVFVVMKHELLLMMGIVRNVEPRRKDSRS